MHIGGETIKHVNVALFHYWEKRPEAVDFRWNGASGTLQLLHERCIGEDFISVMYVEGVTFARFACNFCFLGDRLPASSVSRLALSD